VSVKFALVIALHRMQVGRGRVSSLLLPHSPLGSVESSGVSMFGVRLHDTDSPSNRQPRCVLHGAKALPQMLWLFIVRFPPIHPPPPSSSSSSSIATVSIPGSVPFAR